MMRFFTIFRKVRAIGALFVAAALALSSCDQSAIFNSISNETKKKTALIAGTPTRMVVVSNTLYVANGNLWKRPSGGNWSSVATSFTDASGSTYTSLKIRDLAAIGTTLYALTVTDTDNLLSNTTTTKVWYSTDGGSAWKEITFGSTAATYTVIDALYTAGPSGSEKLFAAAHKTDTSKTYEIAYAALRLNAGGTTFDLVIGDLADGGLLVGAAYDGTYYYAATTNLGIYQSSDATNWTVMSSTTGYYINGIHSVKGATIAVSHNEYTLIKLTAADTAFTATNQNYVFSGNIDEYDTGTNGAADGTPDYLLLGIKTGTTYGYREIALSGGTLTSATPSVNKPSSSSTVLDYDQYAGALGVVPVLSMHQSWEGANNILYASTVLQGLWTTVARDDWNLVSE